MGWETHVVPDIGERPQAIINKQIEPYNIFIGIMWKRFGTPTGEAESGTEEEFNLAFKCRKEFGWPRIMFYFNQETFMPQTQNDLEQMSKVIEFRERLRREGLTWDYTGAENFKSIVDQHLSKLIVQWYKEGKKETVSFERRTTLPPHFAHPYPMQENFTGRQKERALLSEWLEKDPTPMLALVAIGGMGKSALAWYWLDEDLLRKGNKFDGVIWWSFYDKESSFERFLENSISYASGQKINPKEMESTWDKMQTFFNIFHGSNFLLILDGLERVLRAYAGLGSPYQGDAVKEDERQDFRACIDPNVGKLLQWLSAGYPQTKTLLTSRLFPKELDGIAGCRRIDMENMDKEDAVKFLRAQGVTGTHAEIQAACEAYGYHPLCLRLLSGMIAQYPEYPGDIAKWREYNPIPELKPKEHHILEIAYNALEPAKQEFLSKLAAFRSPMEYDAIAIFNTFGDKKAFGAVLKELVNRGVLLWHKATGRYDLHPIVRAYCYDCLTDKKDTHTRLRDYFAAIPSPEKIESLEDLNPVIELYHHTVRAGWYDQACGLYYNRLQDFLFYRLGAYQTCIELLQSLFPDGEDRLPRLSYPLDRAWALSSLANSYSMSGQPKQAVPLQERANAVDPKPQSFAIGLSSLAMLQIFPGDLEAAEKNLLRSLELSREMRDELREAISHQELGRLLAYRGQFKASERELSQAYKLAGKIKHKQNQGLTKAYCALRALLMGDAAASLQAAHQARKLAEDMHLERDITQAEWLLGAAHLAKGELSPAETHLSEAIHRCRRINLIELEPDILLELAKLRHAQRHNEEALDLATEALNIADRCEYRLKQADIHNFFAMFYIAKNEWAEAQKHADIAQERASCGYKLALKKANKLSAEISKYSR